MLKVTEVAGSTAHTLGGSRDFRASHLALML